MAIIIWFRLLYLALVDPVLYLKQADIQTNAGGIQILEELIVNVNETVVADMADLAINIASNSAAISSNDGDILSISTDISSA